MESKKINQLATNVNPQTSDLTTIGDPITGQLKKITWLQVANLIGAQASVTLQQVTDNGNTTTDPITTGGLTLTNLGTGVPQLTNGNFSGTYGYGLANGVATLDSGGKIPASQLPSSVMEYKGTWNASTNTPTLADGTGDNGDVYLVNVAGSQNLGSGTISFAVGDWVVYNGTIWQKSLNSNAVASVFGRTGTIVAQEGDYNIDQLGDVAITSAATNDYLRYNGSSWVNTQFPTFVSSDKLVLQVRNNSGATINKGTVVYINGAAAGYPTIAKAQANADNTSAQTLGLVQDNIANNSNGVVVIVGQITGIDTSAYTAGTQLYLSGTTAGAFTSTKTLAPTHLVYVGIVTTQNAVNGVIEVKIQNGYELDEIHDVAISSVADKNVLAYESSTSLWKNKSLSSILVAGDIPEGSNNYIQNNATATAQNAKFYIGTGNRIDNSTNTDGIYLANSGIGNGYRVANSSTGSGIVIDNSSGGTGLLVGNTSTGSGIVVDNSTAATGYLFRGTKNAVNKILMDDSGNITAASYIVTGGSSSGFLKANGSIDTTSYLSLAGGTLTGQLILKESSSSTDYTKGLRFPNDPFGGSGDTSGLRLYSSGGENQVLELYVTNDVTSGSLDTINFYAPTNDAVTINGNKIWNSANITPVSTSRSLTINGTAFDLSADRTWSVGTVTSVAALTIGTTGTDISSTVATGTTTPVITLNIPTASATNRGALSSTDWTTFNNKQNALTSPLYYGGTVSTPSYTGTNYDNLTTSGYYQVQGTGDTRGTLVLNVGGSVGVAQIEYSYGGSIRWRNKTDNTTWESWSNIWTSANDGTGSGLDADLLDGNHASAFQSALNGTGFVKISGTTISYDNTSYLPLGGGTLTGSLNGTSSSMSSTSTATAFIPTGSTIPTNGMYLSAANTLGFATNSGNAATLSTTSFTTFSTLINSVGLYIDNGAGGGVLSINSFEGSSSYIYLKQVGTNMGAITTSGAGYLNFQHNNGTTLAASFYTNVDGNILYPKTESRVFGVAKSDAGNAAGGNLTVKAGGGVGSGASGHLYLGAGAGGSANGDIYLGLAQTTNNNTAGLSATYVTIKTGGDVGIGVSSLLSPGDSRRLLQISNGTNGAQIALGNSTTESNNPRIFSGQYDLNFAANKASGKIEFYTDDTVRLTIAQAGTATFTSTVSAPFFISQKGTQSTANTTWTTVYTIPQTTAAQGIYYVYAHYLDGQEGMAFIQILADRTYRRSINGSNGATVSVRLDGNNIQVYQSYGVTVNIDWSILIQKLL